MLEFRGLGAVEVQHGDQLLHLGGGKQRGLLALLMLEPGRVVPADRLVTRLWPDGQADRDTLYRLASRLRRALADDTDRDSVVARSGGYMLAVDPDQVDIHRFDRLVGRGRAALSTQRYKEAAQLLFDALSLWRGAALTGVAESVRQGPAARLDELRLLAIEDSMAAELALDHHEQLVPQLRELVAEHPVRERLVGPLMLALNRCGRRGEALEVYRRARQQMIERVGLEPSEALQAIQQQILTDDGAAADPPFANAARRSESKATGPSQLPPDLSSLTGREAELERILLSAASVGKSPGTVVVTALDGMAGIGKTVLAVHAAHRLAEEFPDGRLFIDLHGFTRGMEPVSPATALDRLLRSIEVPGEQIPLDVDERATLWRERLAGKRCLLLLDNAATEDQVLPLLPAAEGCLVIVTSRNRLGDLDDAVMVSLDVLSTPEAITLLHAAAGPDRLDGESRETITEAVHSCGHLPLAIRLLAARMRNESNRRLVDLVDRLRADRGRMTELDSGRRSVAAAFDVSYSALDLGPQRQFRLLGLHPGTDFDIYAAAALTDIELSDAEQNLNTLVDANLLEPRANDRFAFHDLIRSHAAATADRVESWPDRTAAAQRLLDYYVSSAVQAMKAYAPTEPYVRHDIPETSTPAPTFDFDAATHWLDTELPNLVAIAGFATDHQELAHVSRLSMSLHRYLENGAHNAEALSLHRHHQRAAINEGDRLEQARALRQIGATYGGMSDNAASLDAFNQALSCLTEADDRSERARLLNNLGAALSEMARYSEARDRFSQALALFDDINDLAGKVYVLDGLSHVANYEGKLAESKEYALDALAAARHVGDPQRLAGAHYSVGLTYFEMELYHEALDHLQASLQLRRETGDRSGACLSLIVIGHAYRGLGKYAESLEQGQQALATAREIADPNAQLEAHQIIGETLQTTGRPQQALEHLDRALFYGGELGQERDQARTHDALGQAHRDIGQLDKAREHWRQALDIYQRLGLPYADDIRAKLAELDA